MAAKRTTRRTKKSTALPSAPASRSLEELIREQGVKPITDLERLSKLWPAAHDPIAFDKFLHEERAARRTSKPRRKTA